MSYEKLVEGFHLFRKTYYQSGKSEAYKRLVRYGQKPDTLFIACSDSRIDPAILTDSSPGDFFAIRNIAALVPPYDHGGQLHGISSAIEYAVRHLEVTHIIIMGHARCGGIHALATDNYQTMSNDSFKFLHDWLHIAFEAKRQVFTTLQDFSETRKICILEQAAILTSMENMLSFPWIKDKYERKEIQIHGWYFDIEAGRLLTYDAIKQMFTNIMDGDHHHYFSDGLSPVTSFINNIARNSALSS